ncbi:MAG: tRNA pseudouridine(55) synthase TruB [Bacteroidetes bacterium]|nr:tRNA pseudouridine(55) synthase TruB [Bacteroidota bacterium]
MSEETPILTAESFALDREAALEQCNSLSGAMLLIDKSYGITSFVPVYILRKILTRLSSDKWVKVGHAGTLDPLATGLLILGTRRATRSLTEFLGSEKVYQAELRLGIVSPSFDLETPITVESDLRGITNSEVEAVVLGRVGEQMQFPPVFSAVKQGGKPVYKAARKGKPVTLEAKPIEIYAITDLDISLPYVRFSVHCSKGTYIRSLAHEIGEILGTGAVLTALRRTHIGEYSVHDALHSDELRQTLSSLNA